MSFSPARPRTVAVIGDVHAEDQRLRRTLQWLGEQAPDAIVCTGDIADGPGDLNACIELLQGHGVATVAGNHDRWLLQDRVRHVTNAHNLSALTRESRDWLAALPRTLEMQTRAGPLLLCHGVGENDLGKIWPGSQKTQPQRCEVFDAMLAEQRFRLFVNGHMHFRVIVNFTHSTLVNAGTLTGPRPGFLVLDLDALQVYAYELKDERPTLAMVQPMFCPERRVWKDTQDFDGDWQPVVLHG